MEQTERIIHKLSPADSQRIKQLQERTKQELPDLVAKDKLRAEAELEPTLSGALRRAIHRSGMTVDQVAEKAGLDPFQLDEFLMGARTLRSDAIDRVAIAVGVELPSIAPLTSSANK